MTAACINRSKHFYTNTKRTLHNFAEFVFYLLTLFYLVIMDNDFQNIINIMPLF